MAKKKIKLSEIKDALLSNTSFIKNEQAAPAKEAKKLENEVAIEKVVYSKLKLLANYYEKEPTELIHDAISHYLRLKKLDIDEALKNIVVGDDEEE